MQFENPPNPLERVRGIHPWVLDRIIKPPSRHSLLVKPPPLFPPLIPQFLLKRPVFLLGTCLLFLWGTNAYGANYGSPPILSSLTLSSSSILQTQIQPIQVPVPSPTALVPVSAAPSVPTPTATRAPVPTNKYTVKSGDSLWTIARKNGITVDALKAANGLTTTLLHVGDELAIPPKTQ